MKEIDINCDLGEKETLAGLEEDKQIMSNISSCNVSCAFHSGTPFIIEETIKSAVKNKVKIGAHPSYNDRLNYGRLSLKVDQKILRSQIKYQICAIKGMVESLGSRLHHVKAHGALYNDMAKDKVLAALFVGLVKDLDPNLKIYGMPGSVVEEISKQMEMEFCKEVFADRRYASKTALRSRKLKDSVLEKTDDVLKQLAYFLDGQVILYSGEMVDIEVDTLCIHSDTKGALLLSKEINHYIKSKGIRIA